MNVASKWFGNLLAALWFVWIYLSETPNASQEAAEVAGAVRNPYFWLVWQLSSVLSQSQVLSRNRQIALRHRCFYCQSGLSCQTVSFKGRLAGQTHCCGSAECSVCLSVCLSSLLFLSLLLTLYRTRWPFFSRHFSITSGQRAMMVFLEARWNVGQRQ